MRKELITYVSTNEEGEEVSVQRVTADKDFILLKLGTFAVAINKYELAEAMNALSYYGQVFDEEKAIAENKPKLEESRRLAAERQALEVKKEPSKSFLKKKKVSQQEDEGAIVIEPPKSVGLSKSEERLKQMMEGVIGNGPSLELTDKTKA